MDRIITEHAAFFRNVSNYDILKKYSEQYRGVSGEYRIIEHIELDAKQFSVFCSDFIKGGAFLKHYFDKAVIANGIWNGVVVENKNIRILVVMNKYQYPRYTALI